MLKTDKVTYNKEIKMSKFVFKEPELPFIDYYEFINTPIINKYKAMFSLLDLSKIKRYNDSVGCTGYDSHSMIKAIIIKTLEHVPSIKKLIYFLKNNLYLSKYVVGFRDTIPHSSKFTRFLKDFPSDKILQLMANVNKQTYKEENKSISTIAIDSKPIIANTKENNPKNFYHNLSDKTKKPKKNEDATLHHFSSTNDINGRKKVVFFWGYRIHIIIDADRDLPLICKVEPNNQTDSTVAPKLYEQLKILYELADFEYIIQTADKGYDTRNVIETFFELFHGKSVIPKNHRATKPNKNLSNKGVPICEAGLEMKSNGGWKDGHRFRYKFRCPKIKESCVFRKKAYGCVKYIQITDPIKGRVQPFSKLYKDTYYKRQSVERVNAFLQYLNLETQKHFNKKAIENTLCLALLGKCLMYAAFKMKTVKLKKVA